MSQTENGITRSVVTLNSRRDDRLRDVEYTIVRIDSRLKEGHQRRYLRKSPGDTGSIWTDSKTPDEQKQVKTWKRPRTALKWLRNRDYVDVEIEDTGNSPRFRLVYEGGEVINFEIVGFVPLGYRGVEEKAVTLNQL